MREETGERDPGWCPLGLYPSGQGRTHPGAQQGTEAQAVFPLGGKMRKTALPPWRSRAGSKANRDPSVMEGRVLWSRGAAPGLLSWAPSGKSELGWNKNNTLRLSRVQM